MSPEAEKQEEGGTASITIKHEDNNNNTEKGKNNEKKNKDTKNEKEKEKQEWDPMVPFFSMFRYAERFDKFLMIAASLAAVANGAIQPTFSILLGEINDVFTAEKFTDPNYKLEDAITPFCLWFIYMGIAAFVLSYMETGMWMLCGERQIRKVRENYLRAVLRQEIGWFDVSQPSQVSARIAADTAVMQEAIGEKVGNFIHNMSTFIFGFVIGFIQGWQLTLIILAVSPLLGIAGFFMSKVLSSMNKQGLDAYAGAGGVAEECISNMRTVTMFNGHRREAERYALKLIRALAVGMKKGFATGVGVGLLMLIVFGTYALAFWYGSKLVSDGTKNATTGKAWTGGDVISTFFAVLSGSFAIGQAGPALGIFAAGRAAAFKIFAIIERKSKIDPFDPSGEKLDEVHGDIEFRDVVFSYPSRQDVQVLRGLNLLIPQGKTVALVGESGCGKSTTISLLEKFYLADQGQVFLDGVDVKNINTKWLRQNLGLVSQEPQLFATTIAENIRFGKEDATLQEIIEAAKAANAHSFIDRLPQGYETLVGEKGLQMSGGQKQRIAIARAIIKNPKIILLDEATSALDTANERLVQEALDRMMVGRTTIVIAHRLATVKNADKIVVFKEGTVLEEGVHSELMALDGLYAKLVHRQTRKLAWEPTEPALDPNRIPSAVDTLASKPWGGAPMLSPLATMRRQLTRRASSFFLEPSDEDDETKNVSFWRLAKESKPEIVAFLFGLLAASINGTMYPIFAIIYGEIVSTLNNPDPKEMMSDAEFLALMFLARAVAAGIANFFQVYCFAIVGEKLTFRLRYYSFTSILRQNIGWFDDTKNSTGILSTKLATDATLVQGVTTQRVATLFQNVATIVAGLIIAFISGWKLSLVILAVMPCFILSSSFEMKFMKGFSKDAKTAYETAGMVSAEAVGGIRTVASFSNEEKLLAMYCAKLDEPMKVAVRRAHVSGLGFGASQFCTYAINCLAYWYGSRLVDSHEWHVSQSEINSQCSASSLDLDVCTRLVFANKGLQQLTKVFMAIFMSGMSLGQTSQMAPDAAKASTAAESIYSLIDRKSPIDPETVGQSKQAIFGNIAFKNVHFHYPTRPNIRIFRGLDLFAPAGATLALVGDSGGGKSTVLSLIERFYDPIRGTIYLDGIDIKTYDIQFLRSQIAFVSQEPSLFANSIAKNISYGKPDATLDQIEAAAKMANCHDFITALPDGYNTMLGDKHTQLSGGQKQRVAIARAILMNPKVLLLDEATSALDSESEALVQEALEKLMCGRTTIVIAHRLSTIVNSDLIAVMKGGRIAEVGSHQDLMSFGGAYASLVSGQL